jgi:hypothetical protein
MGPSISVSIPQRSIVRQQDIVDIGRSWEQLILRLRQRTVMHLLYQSLNADNPRILSRDGKYTFHDLHRRAV